MDSSALIHRFRTAAPSSRSERASGPRPTRSGDLASSTSGHAEVLSGGGGIDDLVMGDIAKFEGSVSFEAQPAPQGSISPSRRPVRYSPQYSVERSVTRTRTRFRFTPTEVPPPAHPPTCRPHRDGFTVATY